MPGNPGQYRSRTRPLKAKLPANGHSQYDRQEIGSSSSGRVTLGAFPREIPRRVGTGEPRKLGAGRGERTLTGMPPARIARRFLVLLLLSVGCEARRGVGLPPVVNEWVRTELFFGLTKPGGGRVTEEEWRQFLDESVTPRFPGGLTAMRATGWYRGVDDGKLHEEPAAVLVILNPAGECGNATDAKIRELTAEYIRKFEQESVLRSDSLVTASFLTLNKYGVVEKPVDAAGAGKLSR